jgi:hypothetical protein
MRKVSLTGSASDRRPAVHTAFNLETVELFFNTGIIAHEVALAQGLPDLIVGFVRLPQGGNMRRATSGEEPDLEISPLDHLAQFSGQWLPIPYQVSAPFAVQAYLQPGSNGTLRLLLAFDTLEYAQSAGKALDASLDAGRPFRALASDEIGGFLELPDSRAWLARREREGVERALLKFVALVDVLAPLLPKLMLKRAARDATVDVSLVVDFGNSRSSAVLVEGRPEGVLSIPLELRHLGNPLQTSEETFGSRVTFMPSPFDKQIRALAIGESFVWPSIARLGQEAWDRALETPHRYQSTVSSPKRYLWDADLPIEPWYFAERIEGEFRTIGGRLLKYLPEADAGLQLRDDGPSAPPEPRYPPRTMMLFAFTEILAQAYNQLNSPRYRKFQGREGAPRRLAHLVVTYPSGMHATERAVYDALLRNAVVLTCHLLNIPHADRPNWNEATQTFDSFLFVDEALASQMVFVYQEVQHTFQGSMEDFATIYGRVDSAGNRNVRVASIDLGGGTTDVMIADYHDAMAGSGTSLTITPQFQDGVSVAGDEVCRHFVEDILVEQLIGGLTAPADRRKFIELFLDGDAGRGAEFRTLRSKLVVAYWLPLCRCLWSLGEGVQPAAYRADERYTLDEALALFGQPRANAQVLDEADRVLMDAVGSFPGLRAVRFSLVRADIDTAIARCLREPLRRYSDIIAQFDVDVLVLAGRTSKLLKVADLILDELPVTAPRIKFMSRYHVGDWYPSKWRDAGAIRDPKSTVTAGAAILHLASRNALPGFLLNRIEQSPNKAILGLYQDTEPHISHASELFATGDRSAPCLYTKHMRIGFRNVASEEMDGSPIFEIRPATEHAAMALKTERAQITFAQLPNGSIVVAAVKCMPGQVQLEPSDFSLVLRTSTHARYWLDTGVFSLRRHVHQSEDA